MVFGICIDNITAMAWHIAERTGDTWLPARLLHNDRQGARLPVCDWTQRGLFYNIVGKKKIRQNDKFIQR